MEIKKNPHGSKNEATLETYWFDIQELLQEIEIHRVTTLGFLCRDACRDLHKQPADTMLKGQAFGL
jgi:hypothetical protein